LDLAADITARKYGENLLFRRREDWIEWECVKNE
jgi:hypothetical protein